MLTQFRQAPYLISHAPGMSILARWQQDQPAILAQLQALRAAGAGGVSFSPWYGHPDPNLGIPTSFDFAPVFAAIKSAGFTWVQVAPQFYTNTGASDARTNGMNVFQAHWLTIWGIYQALLASGLGFLIDACTEFNDAYGINPGFAAYVNAMWDNVTLTDAPNGTPCWHYTMSFNTANLSGLFTAATDAFQGNWPAILGLHPYSNENGGLYATLRACRQELGGTLWALTETDTLVTGQEAIAQQLNQFVIDTKQPISVVCPWPVLPTTPAGVQIDPACVPPMVSQPWAGVGA